MGKEYINLGSSVPIKFKLETIQSVSMHWHQQIELIYILSGRITVSVKEQTYHLVEDQIILINSYDIHSLSADDCKIAIFEINLSMFDNSLINESTLRFDCNSTTAIDQDIFIPIKKLLALLLKTNTDDDKNHQLMNKSYAYALLYQLSSSFRIEEMSASQDSKVNMHRFEEILKFLNQHYTDNITLKELAHHFYITVPYLSRIFKKYIGVGFTDYMNSLRLSHAINDISNLNWSIEYVAEKNGFSNSRSFVSIFKNKYGILPSQYRNQLSENPTSNSVVKPAIIEESLGFAQHSYLGRLAEYLEDSNDFVIERDSGMKMVEISPVSVAQKGFNLKHTFKNTTSIGKAKHILYAENQHMLRELQKDIGFRYIKFHGILDDDMMVYSEDEHGNPELNFTYIDMVIDFLLSIRLRPFVQLSFMPKALAAKTNRTIFFLESFISLPKDYHKWFYLIKNLVLHLQSRYGSDEIETWSFFLWNEPDSPTSMFGFEQASDYYHFYKCTYDAVKACNPNLIFGCPSVMSSTIQDSTWVTEFLDFCKTNNCYPEFLNYHFYPLSMNNNFDINLQQTTRISLLKSEDAFKDNINTVISNVKKLNWDIEKIYVTEWNSSISHRDLLNDTAFKAPYIVKNILENYDRLDSFGYWVLSDFIEEVKMSKNLYHGGMGLFTYNGIKKSPYYAFTLLSKLGDILIGRGKGYFITKNKNTYQIILYNYQHFSSLYASGELFDMTFTKRYTPFLNTNKKKYVIPLADLPGSYYTLTETILNQQHGSSFDKWVELGALPLDTEQEVNYLKTISIPQLKKRQLEVENGFLTISCELEPHEVRLIEIHPKDSIE